MTIEQPSIFLEYLAHHDGADGQRLPPIPELAHKLGISTGKLREQLEVARMLGMVDVRPKRGTRALPYDFFPAVRLSLLFALARDTAYFDQFGLLRSHVEASFWHEAVRALQPEDKDRLRSLLDSAWEKLRGDPVQIPHEEHRELHLAIFSRLDNPFVLGILEAYWDAYEAVGLNVYADYSYLEQVWTYHQQMVDAILAGDYEAGHRALVEHTGLLQNRPEVGRLSPSKPLPDLAGGGRETIRREVS